MGSGEYFASSPRKKEIFCSVFQINCTAGIGPNWTFSGFLKCIEVQLIKPSDDALLTLENSWWHAEEHRFHPPTAPKHQKICRRLESSSILRYALFEPKKKKIKIKSYALLLVSVLTLFGSYKLQTVRSHQNLHRWQKENLERSKTKPELAARHRTKHRHYQY